jgi:hypothetical protein
VLKIRGHKKFILNPTLTNNLGLGGGRYVKTQQIQRQVCFDVTTPFLNCIKHNGDDASKAGVVKLVLSDHQVVSESFQGVYDR